MLLVETLSQVPYWDGTPEERNKRGKDLARAIVPSVDVERWKREGHTVMRGCYVQDGNALLEVQITGPKGLRKIFLTRTENGLVGKVGAEDLNGSTPATAADLIQLIDRLLAGNNKAAV